MNKKWVRIICIILAALMAASVITVALSTLAGAATSDKLKSLQQERSSLKQKKQDINSKINSLEYEELAVLAKKEVLDERIMLTQDEIENINEQIGVYEELIEEKEEEVAALKDEQRVQWERYKTRIRAMEENGSISYYDIIFGATSFSDMLFRIDAVNAVMEYDEQVYQDLLDAEAATRQAQQELRDTKLELEDKGIELQETMEELDGLVEEANEYIAQLESDMEAYEQTLSELEASEKKIDKQIKEEEERLKKLEEAKKVKGTGTFQWPLDVRGRITSEFGFRQNPVTGKYHNHGGIDIGQVGYGANIRAADTGTVTTSGYDSSYGNYVVINHG
ncbi:MAG: hypothetical protein II387_06835, partial [Oscillospiraceae bacterium]|nr:hypothetical protein [Oscillospiraceae bacterium]